MSIPVIWLALEACGWSQEQASDIGFSIDSLVAAAYTVQEHNYSKGTKEAFIKRFRNLREVINRYGELDNQ